MWSGERDCPWHCAFYTLGQVASEPQLSRKTQLRALSSDSSPDFANHCFSSSSPPKANATFNVTFEFIEKHMPEPSQKHSLYGLLFF